MRVNALRNRRRVTGDPTKLPQSQNLLENQYTVADSGNVGLFQRMPTISVNETCAPTSNMQTAYNLDINNFVRFNNRRRAFQFFFVYKLTFLNIFN